MPEATIGDYVKLPDGWRGLIIGRYESIRGLEWFVLESRERQHIRVAQPDEIQAVFRPAVLTREAVERAQ